jgi:hypothetical protein
VYTLFCVYLIWEICHQTELSFIYNFTGEYSNQSRNRCWRSEWRRIHWLEKWWGLCIIIVIISCKNWTQGEFCFQTLLCCPTQRLFILLQFVWMEYCSCQNRTEHHCLNLNCVYISFWGYVAICVWLYCKWFTVLRLVVAVLHYMFRPTWPSSGVYDVFTFIFLKESASLFLLPFLNVRRTHADGNITSKLIEQYSAAGC